MARQKVYATDDEPTEAKAAEVAAEEAAALSERAEREKACVTVLLLCDHVYMPEDPTTADWANARVTMRYDGKVEGRRTRIACHPTLAAFLQERGQAEILD